MPAIESWLEYATESGRSSMAYFMWDDIGLADLVSDVEPDLLPYFEALPRPVEKADIFRVVVCNSIGGIYGDIDTTPLRSPIDWITQVDIMPWTDPVRGTRYAQSQNNTVNLILGIEADTDEFSDSYWRMGYTYSVQLTQWALAGAGKHPILSMFLRQFTQQIDDVLANTLHTPNNTPVTYTQALRRLDPLELTGPAAITKAAKDYLEDSANLRWQALSGLQDGGRSKLVLDTMILPITAFSPGRGRIGNMGSKAYSSPDARLRHDSQSSWRKFSFRVEMGKACRTIFGGCRYWSKTP
jgi:mannosyltransferase OCH1-like enzyme